MLMQKCEEIGPGANNVAQARIASLVKNGPSARTVSAANEWKDDFDLWNATQSDDAVIRDPLLAQRYASGVRRLGEPLAGNLKTEIKTNGAVGNSELVWECVITVLTEYEAEQLDDETIGGGLAGRPFDPRRNVPPRSSGGGGDDDVDDKDKPSKPCPECGGMHWMRKCPKILERKKKRQEEKTARRDKRRAAKAAAAAAAEKEKPPSGGDGGGEDAEKKSESGGAQVAVGEVMVSDAFFGGGEQTVTLNRTGAGLAAVQSSRRARASSFSGPRISSSQRGTSDDESEDSEPSDDDSSDGSAPSLVESSDDDDGSEAESNSSPYLGKAERRLKSPHPVLAASKPIRPSPDTSLPPPRSPYLFDDEDDATCEDASEESAPSSAGSATSAGSSARATPRSRVKSSTKKRKEQTAFKPETVQLALGCYALTLTMLVALMALLWAWRGALFSLASLAAAALVPQPIVSLSRVALATPLHLLLLMVAAIATAVVGCTCTPLTSPRWRRRALLRAQADRCGVKSLLRAHRRARKPPDKPGRRRHPTAPTVHGPYRGTSRRRPRWRHGWRGRARGGQPPQLDRACVPDRPAGTLVHAMLFTILSIGQLAIRLFTVAFGWVTGGGASRPP